MKRKLNKVMATRKETKVFRSRKDAITAILNEKTCFPFSFEGHLSTYVKLKELKKTYTIIDNFKIFRDHIQIEAKLEIIYGV